MASLGEPPEADRTTGEASVRRGTNVTFTYDWLDRRTNIAYGTQSTVRLQYDSVSRVTNIVDSVGGTIRLAYDALDRLTTEIGPNGTNTYSYNDDGLRTNLASTKWK
jgi:YD repeat-containing protein